MCQFGTDFKDSSDLRELKACGIFEGTTLALMEQVFRYKAPVFFGDTIHLRLTVDQLKPSSKGGKGVVTFKSEVVKQDGTVVVEGHWVVLIRDRG